MASRKGLLAWFKNSQSRPKQKTAHPYSHSRIIHQEPTGRPVFAEHERDHHITTSGRRALTRAQFALPPGPEEKRRGIKGRLPIDTIKRAHAALTRASMMHHQGHISAGQLEVARNAVHKAWPSIEITRGGARSHSTMKTGFRNEYGLTYARWCAAASCHPSPAARAAWSEGEDPSDYRAAAQRESRSHSTMKHVCYVITVPPTAEQGSYKTRHCGPKATARSHALWDYNSARRHDGLPPVTRLPSGTKITKELATHV